MHALFLSFVPLLFNFLFKIIPKTLSTRLSSIIELLVLPNQCGFVKRRNISSYTTDISECINMLDRRSFGGNMGIVIDFTKTFDTIEWPFLLSVL